MRAARFGGHFEQQTLYPVLRPDRFAGNHVLARNEAFNAATQVDIDAVAVHPLDHAAQQFSDPPLIAFADQGAFRFAHLLVDHVLGGVGPDMAKIHPVHGPFHHAAGDCFRVDPQRVRQP